MQEQGAKEAFNLGKYLHLPRSHAADGTALAGLKDLIQALLSACPHCEVLYGELKTALTALVLKYPIAGAFRGQNSKAAPGDLAERLMTIMCHFA